MKRLEELANQATNDGIALVDYKFHSQKIKGLYCNNTIALNIHIRSNAEKTCILAEEMGYHYTSNGNIIDLSVLENRKQEYSARLWAYNKRIGLSGIVQAYEHNCRNRHEMPDYRKGNGIHHQLVDIVMIGLLTIICNGNTFVDMALFGETHEELLSQFLELPYGIPSHDTFADVFAKLDPKVLASLFQIWVKEIKELIQGSTIAIDGKTIRRSKGAHKKAVHVVTAFASEMQLVLGQVETDEKSNEITAIPKLLKMFCVKGNIITIDAMGTQMVIAKKIIEKGGDYILTLKKNPQSLYEEVCLYMDCEVMTQDKRRLQKEEFYEKTAEKGHGRIEVRECFISTEINWLDVGNKWAGFSGIGVIRSRREEIGKEQSESHPYFIYSMKDTNASDILRIKREHWAIENTLHWALDVTFREDECRARLENAVENLNILRKQAMQLIKQGTTVKGSMRSKRLRCAYDIVYALLVLGVNDIS